MSRRGPTRRCLLAALLTLPVAAQGTKATVYSPPEQLRNYALSVCLANAFPNSLESKDASAAASGYLELGSGPIDAYPAIVALAKQFLSRSYTGQADVQFQTMKCIDLQYSPELTRLIRHYTAMPTSHRYK